jgi:DNA-binding NarL/FixJ family response regulator
MIIRRDWTPREDAILQQGALTGQTVGEIAREVGRTMSAVLTRARNHQIKLRRSASKSLSAPDGLIPGGAEAPPLFSC